MRRTVWTLLALFTTAWLPAADLKLAAGDVTVEARADGYHLFIRQKAGVASVLLTEAFERPDHKLATYAYRAAGPNPVNDSEKRLLNGAFLPQPHHSLISSTPKADQSNHPVFEVVLPPVVEYGNTTAVGARSGRLDLRQVLNQPDKPVWFSIRTFAKPYADYTGAYLDNAYELRTFLRQVSAPTADHYESGLEQGFGRLGNATRTTGIDDALDYLRKVLERTGDSLDLVVAVDTTKSMVVNLETVQKALVPALQNGVGRFKSFRVGLVFYRDYMEDYLTRTAAFTSDLAQVQKDLNQAQAAGGGDIPEAVTEAVWAGLTSFRWTAVNRVLLVLGDAPPHPAPRGDVTEAMVRDRAKADGVEVDLLMLPQAPM